MRVKGEFFFLNKARTFGFACAVPPPPLSICLYNTVPRLILRHVQVMW